MYRFLIRVVVLYFIYSPPFYIFDGSDEVQYAFELFIAFYIRSRQLSYNPVVDVIIRRIHKYEVKLANAASNICGIKFTDCEFKQQSEEIISVELQSDNLNKVN